MARDQASIALTDGAWTQITNGDVTAITFQVLRGEAFIRFTTDATAPTEANGIRYGEGEGVFNASVSDLTALTGADRVWAKPVSSNPTTVYVDHG